MKTRVVPLLPILLAAAVALCACAPANADPLAYQRREARVTGTLTTDTGTFSIMIALPKMADGTPRRECTVTLLSPATVEGMTVSVSGQTVTMSSGSVTIPVSAAASSRWQSILALFSLDGDVNSVTEKDGTVTLGVGSSPSRVFVSFASGSSTPSEIRTEDGTLALSVQEYAFTEQTTEGTDNIDS